MVREIILDTETTGLDPATGDRIVEIGARRTSEPPADGPHLPRLHQSRARHAEGSRGRARPVQRLPEGQAGLRAPSPQEFLEFIGDATLIIHNASFDMAFLNAELGFLRLPAIPPERVVDTLHIARQKHPGCSQQPRCPVPPLWHRQQQAHQAWRAARLRTSGGGLSRTHRRPADGAHPGGHASRKGLQPWLQPRSSSSAPRPCRRA